MLNFLRITLCSFIAITLLSLNLNAKELEDETLKTYKGEALKALPLDIPIKQHTNTSKRNKYQISDWVVMDSLANALSYMHPNIRPFGVDPNNPNLIFTIKRGSQPDDAGQSSDPNSKNNLFLLYSSDNGQTWSEQYGVYDNKKDGFGQGRYPSIHVKALDPVENEYFISFVGALVNEQEGKWDGYVFGVALFSDGSYSPGLLPAQGETTIEGTDYGIGSYTYDYEDGLFKDFPTPTQILSYAENDNYRAMFPAPIRTVPFVSNEVNVQNNNNTAIVSSGDDISSVDYDIPNPFKSENFELSNSGEGKPDSVHFQTSNFQDVRLGRDGFSYISSYNDYKDDGTDVDVLGISKSTDEGRTWSEFEDFPTSLIDEFVATEWDELESGNYFLNGRFTNDLIVEDENNYSYFVLLSQDWTADKINYSLAKKYLVELYKEDGEFGIRKISSEIPTNPIIVLTQDGNFIAPSPLDYELQAASTYDGQSMIVKWVQPVGLAIDTSGSGTTIGVESSNVYISVKNKDAENWSKPINITANSEPFLQKSTWIPPYIPNDLNNIMLMRLRTEGDLSVLTQRTYIAKQYVETTLISIDDLNSVESNKQLSDRIIKNIYPNPAKSNLSFDINLEKTQSTEITLYSIDGVEVQNIYSGIIVAGSRTFNTNVKDLSQGTYILKVTFDDITVSQILKVVK